MVWWNDEGAAGGTLVYLWLGRPSRPFAYKIRGFEVSKAQPGDAANRALAENFSALVTDPARGFSL
jgi:hypothetical protein